jgi:3-phosphoshikimate 1-carboxyvinyltransferase
MQIAKLTPSYQKINQTIKIPGCLSYTTRGLILASLTEQEVILENPLESEDVIALKESLQTLGIQIQQTKDGLLVKNSIKDVQIPTQKTITEFGDVDFLVNINLSGRSARSLLPLLCLIPGEKILTAGKPFLKRPMHPQVDGLRQLGAEIEYLGEYGKLPVKINSSTLREGVVKMPGNISSQFFAGIMMIAPLVGQIELIVEGDQVSKSYIDMTIEAMKNFGVEVENNDYQSYLIRPNQKYQTVNYKIESDYSTASYFGVLAALTGSSLVLEGLRSDSLQGDKLVFEALQQMGNEVVFENNNLSIFGKSLKPFKLDMERAIDQPPAMSILAAFCQGESQISGVEILQYKESNRLEAIQKELSKMQIATQTDGKTLSIFGGNPKSAQVSTYHDHRIAMSFALAGFKLPDMLIENPEVVSKSYPEFWKVLQKLGLRVDFFEQV